MLVTKNPTPGETYNIGGNYTCKVGDILKYLISLSSYKKEIKIIEDPKRLRKIDADLQVPDIRKFKKHTKWKPVYKFEDTMSDLLNYWRIQVKNKKFLDR